MGDLTKSSKAKLSPMATNYVVGSGEGEGGAKVEKKSVEGLSNLDTNYLLGEK
jgi:hypothetical protein